MKSSSCKSKILFTNSNLQAYSQLTIYPTMRYDEIEKLCLDEEKRLLDKYFGSIVQEAASESHESIEEYTADLPLKIESEYMDFLTHLWNEITHAHIQSIETIIGYNELRETINTAGKEELKKALEDAQRHTLWEKIMHTNHKDVTYYKGLLLEYTRELLSCSRCSVMEKVNLHSDIV